MNPLGLTDLQRLQLQLNTSPMLKLDGFNNQTLLQASTSNFLNSARLLGASPLGLLTAQSLLNQSNVDTARLLALANNKSPLFNTSLTANTLSELAILSKLTAAAPLLNKGPTVTSGRIEPFPEKLQRLLREVEALGRTDIISFIADDTFRIHDPAAFFKDVVPQYFRQSKLTSFKRQLKLYGFELITYGPNKGGYRHELFSKKNPEKCRQMRRVAIKTPKSPTGEGGGKKGDSSSVASKDEGSTSSL